MTWTKLGEEWPDAARELTDAAFRIHVEALCWSNRRGLDLTIPKRDLKRFAETDDPDTAVKNLVAAGWWQDCGDSWFIGVQFADWQLEATVVNQRREANALRVRRHRLHEAGDHSICLPKNCRHLRTVSGSASPDALPNARRNALPGTERNGTDQNGTAHEEEEPLEPAGLDVVPDDETPDDWPPIRQPGAASGRCERHPTGKRAPAGCFECIAERNA